MNANPDIGLPDYSDPNAIITCPCNMYDCTTASGEYNAGDYSVIAAYANCGNDREYSPFDLLERVDKLTRGQHLWALTTSR